MKLVLIAILSLSSLFSQAGEVEKIMGVMYDEKGIHYQVFTGGCTKKEDFATTIKETYPVQIVLERKKFDFCEAYAPYGMTVSFSWQELGITENSAFIISNPRAQAYRAW